MPILGRKIPIIADEAVEREFGGGALKVTPGHDPTDFQIGERHGLPVISILDEAARINENGGPYAGLDRYEARKKLWEDMRQAGLVLKEEPYTLTVPRSQRGGEIVEPMVSTQWFVRIQPLADAALQAVRDWAHPHRARALHQSLLQLAGKHPGLVHLPPALVGSPHPGLVLRRLRRDDCCSPGSNPLRPLQQRPHPARPGCARHLVLLRSLALFNTRLARADPRLQIFLPDFLYGDRLRHPVLLGGADDHVGA